MFTLKNWLRLYLEEILILLGAAAITYGVAQMHIPSAWIVGGLFGIAWAYLQARASQPVQEIEATAGGNEV